MRRKFKPGEERYCVDCDQVIRKISISQGDPYLEHSVINHARQPFQVALNLEETAEVLGKTKGEVNHLVRTGRIQVVRKGVRVWVTQDAIRKYGQAVIRGGRPFELLAGGRSG